MSKRKHIEATRFSKRLLARSLKEGKSIDPAPLYRESGSDLLKLPDDCFFKIAFYIRIRDILNIGETCQLGRIVVMKEILMKSIFYPSYGLDEQEMMWIKGENRITTECWKDEIKKRIDCTLWIGKTTVTRDSVTDRLHGYTSYEHRHVHAHPKFTLHDLSRCIFHRMGWEESKSMIEFCPVQNIKVLGDSYKMSMTWSSPQSLLLLNRPLKKCITKGKTTCHIAIMMCTVEMSTSQEHANETFRKITAEPWFLDIHRQLTAVINVVQNDPSELDCSLYDHPMQRRTIPRHNAFIRYFIRRNYDSVDDVKILPGCVEEDAFDSSEDEMKFYYDE